MVDSDHSVVRHPELLPQLGLDLPPRLPDPVDWTLTPQLFLSGFYHSREVTCLNNSGKLVWGKCKEGTRCRAEGACSRGGRKGSLEWRWNGRRKGDVFGERNEADG